MIEAGTPERFLLIRRPLPPPATPTANSTRGTDTGIPEGTSFVYCYVPKDSPISPTLSTLVLMAGRRWSAEETTATGKGPLGWDHNQYRTWTSVQHHTALCGLAMLKANALRARLENISVSSSETDYSETNHRDSDAFSVEKIPTRPPSSPQPIPGRSPDVHDDLMIPLGDSVIPVRPDQLGEH